MYYRDFRSYYQHVSPWNDTCRIRYAIQNRLSSNNTMQKGNMYFWQESKLNFNEVDIISSEYIYWVNFHI